MPGGLLDLPCLPRWTALERLNMGLASAPFGTRLVVVLAIGAISGPAGKNIDALG
jgi:hypothetical protein